MCNLTYGSNSCIILYDHHMFLQSYNVTIRLHNRNLTLVLYKLTRLHTVCNLMLFLQSYNVTIRLHNRNLTLLLYKLTRLHTVCNLMLTFCNLMCNPITARYNLPLIFCNLTCNLITMNHTRFDVHIHNFAE